MRVRVIIIVLILGIGIVSVSLVSALTRYHMFAWRLPAFTGRILLITYTRWDILFLS